MTSCCPFAVTRPHDLRRSSIFGTCACPANMADGLVASPHNAAMALWMVFVLVGAGLFLYLNLFVLPHTPILLTGDQVFWWMNAQRMLSGERLYRDFFQFTPPGTDLFYWALFKAFGVRIWVTNVAVMLLGMALCAVCFKVARQLMGRWPALLATSLFLTLLYGKDLNATHHWFSMLPIMGGAAITMKGRTLARTTAVGVLLGTAAFFNQAHGTVAVLAFALWLLWEGFPNRKTWRDPIKHPAVVLASFAIALLSLSAHFLFANGAKQLWYYEVTFVRRYMVGGLSQFPGLPEFPTWRRLPVVGQYIFVCMVLPAVYPTALVRRWRTRMSHDSHGNGVALLALLGLALFLEVAISANWLRLYAVAIPGIVLLVWFADCAGRARRHAIGLIWLAVFCLALGETWSRHQREYVVTELPAGKVALAVPAFAKLHALREKTHPGEFFFQPTWPGVYTPLQLRNPVYLDTVWPNEESRPAYVERSIEELESKQVRYILWSPNLNYSDPSSLSSDHLAPLRDYLHDHYQQVEIFSDQDELWERRH